MSSLLKVFFSSLGVEKDEAIKALENNAFQIQLKDSLLISTEIDEKTGDIIFSAELGTIKTDFIPQIAVLLLQANVFWTGTNGATLALDQSTSTVLLLDRVSPNTELKNFEARLTNFLETASLWSTHLEQLQQNNSVAMPANSTESMTAPLNFKILA